MARMRVREGINNGIRMLTPFISSLMGFLIAVLNAMRVMVSYSTSVCVNFCGLHPPCFHPGVSRLQMADEAHRCRIYAPSTHSSLFRQRLAKRKSNVCFVEKLQVSERAASVNTVYDDEEAESFLVEGDHGLNASPDTSHEHMSVVGCAQDLIIFSDDAKDGPGVLDSNAQENSAQNLVEHVYNFAWSQNLVEHVHNSGSELNVFQPFEELIETNARPTDDAPRVSEVGLDSAKEFLGNTLAGLTPQSFQELQDEGLDLEVSASKRFNFESDAYDMRKAGVGDVPWKLKQRLSTQRQALDMAHVLLERQRMESSASAQESMAMIAMLQEEKAALVLEATQQRRMAEEKELFDENALIDLRDSLVKREGELLALEKERKFYRRFFFLKDQVATTKEKQAKSGSINGETVAQQHSVLEYPDANKGIKSRQHASISRDLCRSSIDSVHPLCSPDFHSRSMIARDLSRATLKKEASELLSRLPTVEADRELMKHTLELRRKERWELQLLQDVVIEALKSLQASAGQSTTNALHRACSVSAVEAEIYRSKRPRGMDQ